MNMEGDVKYVIKRGMRRGMTIKEELNQKRGEC